MNAPADVAPYLARRSRLLAAIGEGVAVVPTAPELPRNRDTFYPYRHDSYFYYLTGFREPEAVLVLLGGNSPRSVLFCREKNLEREIWDGTRLGVELAREVLRIDETYPIATFEERLPELLRDRDTLYAPLALGGARGADWDRLIARALERVRAMARAGVGAPKALVDVYSILDEMRLIKDEHEIALMRRAAEITAAAHVRAMRFARPGQWEYEVEAELMHEFIRSGARAPAYNPIVASGPNACVLHYSASSRRMEPGDLLLIDAGCEYEGYAADITRTFPVSGKFTGPQRDLYEAVLAAQTACMEVLRPGEPFHRYHEVAVEQLTRAMIDLGLLPCSYEEAIEKKTYERFYMHRAGHWLGMDVHDAGAYRVRGESQILRPGMVVTNEPGLYVRPAPDVAEAFWNLGVRIEDDVLITPEGHEVLTAAAPKTVTEVEAVCAR
ncbi:MAG: aminopeptidase P N-terminal domain-containing protein [Casimicrobiaceae bacterium]|nr:aminopeptidase P N-terminal domain-containing protein [Casimicrobiaceae bacterium]